MKLLYGLWQKDCSHRVRQNIAYPADLKAEAKRSNDQAERKELQSIFRAKAKADQ